MRRRFHEAIVGAGTKQAATLEGIGLAYCDQLFSVEKKAEDLSAMERHNLRQKESKPVIEAFYQWVETYQANTLPQSLLGKAFTYAQNQKKYLLAFLTDGRVELSNNRAERSIKPFVIGRKNWLFCNTPGGAISSAATYSLVQTAIENGLNPQAYLIYLFKLIQQQDQMVIEKMLPWAKEIPDSCKIPVTKA